ncbi:conjugal transfer protein TraF [Salmonella enterica subsp. enterica serovar Typhimurium]|nr:conjugal transfer protein TraF [Salmonella enterica subsp. enterica serovar Typhimurium]
MGSCAAPSAKGDDKFITTDYLQQCPRPDQGQAQRLGVKYFPAMMLVDPKQGSVRPLSYGFITQDDLAKQFLNVSEDFKPNF